jgi:hypothetical protein
MLTTRPPKVPEASMLTTRPPKVPEASMLTTRPPKSLSHSRTNTFMVTWLHWHHEFINVVRQSSGLRDVVSIATDYGLGGPGIKSQ